MRFLQCVGLVGTVSLVVALVGCPEEQVQPPSSSRGKVVVTALDPNGDETTEVQADGRDYATLQIEVTDKDDKPWSGPVTVTTTIGAFGAVPLQNSVQVTTGSDGTENVQFVCQDPVTEQPVYGGASINVRSSVATTRITLNCVEVQDRRALVLTGPSGTNFHYADGFSEVELTATAVGFLGEPENSAPIDFSTTDGSQRLIDGGNQVPAVTRYTDASGVARVSIKAPNLPGQVQVQASWQYDALEAPLTDTISISFAEDQSVITLTTPRDALPANGTASVDLTATVVGFDGTPVADGTEVTFAVAPATYSLSDESVDTAGGVATTTLQGSTNIGTALVNAEFEVDEGRMLRSNSVSIDFIEPGHLLLVAEVDPPEIWTNEEAAITVTAERDGVSIGAGQAINFDLSTADGALATFGAQGATSSVRHVSEVTDANGQVSTTIQALRSDTAGAVVVTVSTVDSGNNNELVETMVGVNIKRLPLLQSVIFTGADPAVLGTRGSSRPATAVVSFKALDDNNTPMEGVRFVFPRPITIDQTVTISTLGGGNTALSDASGSVSAYLSAGFQAHPVRVIAVATDPRDETRVITTTSDAIPITAGLASWTHSWLVCDYDKAALMPPDSRDCQVVLADRFSERVPEGTSVQFRVESGNITPSETTGADGATGEAVYLTGAPPPAETYDTANPPRTYNPRDGAVSILAYTRGEEPFTDLDGNGAYDPGEPFVDFPEPFIDKQDNCVRNDATDPLDEYYIDPALYGGVADPYMVLIFTDPFVDGNNDGVWSPANGVWDDDTLIWFQAVTLHVQPISTMEVRDVQCASGGGATKRCDPTNDPDPGWASGARFHTTPWVEPGEFISLRVLATDYRGNCPAPGVGATYSIEFETDATNTEYPSESRAVGPWDCGLGTAFHPLTSNGHVIPYCSVMQDIEIDDTTLNVTQNGLGSHPQTFSFNAPVERGRYLTVTITFSGDNGAGGDADYTYPVTYVVSCNSNADCGTGLCMSSGLCFYPEGG